MLCKIQKNEIRKKEQLVSEIREKSSDESISHLKSFSSLILPMYVSIGTVCMHTSSCVIIARDRRIAGAWATRRDKARAGARRRIVGPWCNDVWLCA